MRPAKGLYPFSSWLLRLTMLFVSYVFFFDVIKSFDFSSIQFYIAAVFCIFAVLLFVGGFLSNSSMTVLSSFFLMGISIYKAVLAYQSDNYFALSVFLLSLSANLMIMSVGNKR